jgi:hypothetical protein
MRDLFEISLITYLVWYQTKRNEDLNSGGSGTANYRIKSTNGRFSPGAFYTRVGIVTANLRSASVSKQMLDSHEIDRNNAK